MRQALYDKDGVLVAHGFTNFKAQPGETVRDVPNDYNQTPGTVRLVGGREQPYAPPVVVPGIDTAKAADLATVDAAVADTFLPLKMRDALAALRRRMT